MHLGAFLVIEHVIVRILRRELYGIHVLHLPMTSSAIPFLKLPERNHHLMPRCSKDDFWPAVPQRTNSLAC
jgi:hypothetical protein